MKKVVALFILIILFSCSKQYPTTEEANSFLYYSKLMAKETFKDNGFTYKKSNIYFLNWIDTTGGTEPYFISVPNYEDALSVHSTNMNRFETITQYKRLP